MESKKILKYPEANMLAAIEDVNRGMSYNAASKKHGVPRITLMGKRKGQFPICRKMGPPSKFSSDHELILVNWVKSLALAGFPLTKETFMESVSKLALELKITFNGNPKPGKKWLSLFLKRHQDITFRTGQNLTSQRRAVTQENINQWFEEVAKYIKEKKIENVIKDPNCVFNCDETAFFLNPKPGKVLAPKGCKTVYNASGNDEKFNITTLITANANGKIAPPLVVYRYTRIPQAIAKNIPSDWAIGKSKKGWMTQELFFEYIANIFEPWLEKEGIPKPVVMFLDGHISHLSLQLSQFCIDKKIEIIALYPNTHIMQPIDVSVFHVLKTIWRQKVADWKIQHNGDPPNKYNFATVLKEVLPHIKDSTIKNGFKKCVLVPWDPNAVKVNGEPSADSKMLNKRSTEEDTLFFTILEREIGKDKISSFMKSQNEWEGPAEDTSLFNLWKSWHQHQQQNTEEKQSNEELSSTQEPETFDLLSQESELSPAGPVIEEKSTQELQVPPGTPLNNVTNINASSTSTTTDLYHHKTTPLTRRFTDPKENIPSPFKRALFWREEGSTEIKKKRKEKLPAIATSIQMLEYFNKKLSSKKEMERQKEERKIKRDERKRKIEEKKAESKKKAKSAKVTKRSRLSTSSSSSNNSSTQFSIQESDMSETLESENEEELLIASNTSYSELKEGDYILTKFKGGKRNSSEFKFVCVIQTLISCDNIVVMGCKCTDDSRKEFIPVEKDISAINFDQVLTKLEQPELVLKGERVSYRFKESIPVSA